jgi:hypothetical protein
MHVPHDIFGGNLPHLAPIGLIKAGLDIGAQCFQFLGFRRQPIMAARYGGFLGTEYACFDQSIDGGLLL